MGESLKERCDCVASKFSEKQGKYQLGPPRGRDVLADIKKKCNSVASKFSEKEGKYQLGPPCGMDMLADLAQIFSRR